jgi:hypothetical protein
MIHPGPGVKIFVATKPVDFRNYAESMIMQSVWQLFNCCQHLNDNITAHIFLSFEHRLASIAACRAL